MKTQPEHWWPVFATFLRSATGRLRHVSFWSLLAAILEITGLVLIMWVALKHYRLPVNGQTQRVFIALMLTGVITVFYYTSKQSPGFVLRLRVAIYGYTTLAVVLALVGNFGDTVIAQPGYVVLFLAGISSIQVVARTCRFVIGQNDAQPEVWRYGTPVYEKPDEKLTDVSTATWLWQQSGIMCTHRMLENLENALQRVGYELTREQGSDISILSGPAQMRPHLRQQVETELLRAREQFWAPEQTPEMVEDIIRQSLKSGFGQKMLEDILYDLRKRGWRLRKLNTD
ncbi:hypothetical protein K3G69_26525 [Phytobacter diazotrophicus]|uniref:hypothetical protein n=1 Tax=Phytobacter diazotrophicus TaxID=395631 RepID=UPI001C9A1737|nr:hypothetical protein [Phytobacter diazotrophicus]MBY6260034.1 hypothetical protein [Phytobacter diazotrophicus]